MEEVCVCVCEIMMLIIRGYLYTMIYIGCNFDVKCLHIYVPYVTY